MGKILFDLTRPKLEILRFRKCEDSFVGNEAKIFELVVRLLSYFKICLDFEDVDYKPRAVTSLENPPKGVLSDRLSVRINKLIDGRMHSWTDHRQRARDNQRTLGCHDLKVIDSSGSRRASLFHGFLWKFLSSSRASLVILHSLPRWQNGGESHRYRDGKVVSEVAPPYPVGRRKVWQGWLL
jgi:hypothetical protein